MAEKSIGLAVSEVGTAKGRVASFSAAPYGFGTKHQLHTGKITSFDTLWSNVFFHRLFLNVFMWCYRDNINYSEGEGVYVYITDPENDYIKTYFDSYLTFGFPPGIRQTFGSWSNGEPFTVLTSGGLNVVWTPPWYEDDTQTNMNNYHKAGCHIILPSVNATRGLRMPDDRQAEIIRNVSDMAGHYTDEDSTQSQGNWRSGFYNAFSDDGRGCGLITFEWFHYLQKFRPGGAFSIQDPSKYVKLYSPDDVAWRQMAKSSSEVIHTVTGLYDITPIDIDNNNIILSAAEQIKYQRNTIEEGSYFYQSMQDTLSLGIPDTINLEPKIETESYDATMSRLAVLKNNPLVKSAAIYTTNISASVLSTTTTTTTTTTTMPPTERTKVAVGEVKIIDSCGPYNMSIAGRDAAFFELENNIIYLISTNVPPGFLKIDIVLEDHFRPKRFVDIVRPFEIEFDQCVAPIIADRTNNARMPAYSYRRPQSEDFSYDENDEFGTPPIVEDYLWSITRPSLAITPFTEYSFSGEGTQAVPFKATLGGGHSDSNALWIKVQDFAAFTFPYTITYKIVADTAADENFFLFVSEGAETPNKAVQLDTVANQFKLDNAVITESESIYIGAEAKYQVGSVSSLYRNGLAISSTDPSGGNYTQMNDGVSGISYNYVGSYLNNITLNLTSEFSNPSTDPVDNGKSVLWLYHPTFAFLYNTSIKLLVGNPESVKPKQHYATLDSSKAYTNSIKQYLDIPTKGFDCVDPTNYNGNAIQFLSNRQDYAAAPSDPDWLTRNWFQEYPNFSWMYYSYESNNNQPKTGGIPTTGQFVVKGPLHEGVNIVFGYMKSQRVTMGPDLCSLEMTVNATLATTTTTTTTLVPTTTTTTTTTLAPQYFFEVEMVDINPATTADVLSGNVVPDIPDSTWGMSAGENANSIKYQVREGNISDVQYTFTYTAPAGQYYVTKPTILIIETNPSGWVSYTTYVTLNGNRLSGEARVTLTHAPPIGVIGERKFLKFLMSGSTMPTTTTTTTTPVPTTTTTTTTTPPPCNNLIDILCKQTLRCTYNSFSGECDTQVISHEIVAETCCELSQSVVNAKVNNYLDLNPSLRTACINNATAFAPCNDPNDDNICETIVEEYQFIASISCS